MDGKMTFTFNKDVELYRIPLKNNDLDWDSRHKVTINEGTSLEAEGSVEWCEELPVFDLHVHTGSMQGILQGIKEEDVDEKD